MHNQPLQGNFWFQRLWLLCLVFVILSCTTSSTSKKNQSPAEEPPEEVVDFGFDKILERGYITAIMDNSSTGFFIYRGKTMGFEYDLLQAFAKSHNLEMRINITPGLEEGFQKLNSGEGDILAYNLTVTKDRKRRIAFTEYLNLVKMVLIQRKPDNWRDLKLHEIERELIRNPVHLIGKEVLVRSHSSYFDRLNNLSDEIGGDIIIIQDDPEIETEAIIRKVAEGEADFTVSEEDIALVNSTYYPNLDVKTAVSFPTQIAWGVRKNATTLLDTLNHWILDMRKNPDYYTIYNKYYKSRKTSLKRTRSEYFSTGGGKLSPYDSLIRKHAIELDWDWRLLAAQIFKESKFDPDAESWAGAVGLLQLLPTTAEEHNVTDLTDPVQNLHAGTRHLQWLQDYFQPVVRDTTERVKFILAAYNVGHGHVMDAIKLTDKFEGDSQKWDDVKEYLLKKSNSQFFNDPVVRFGYCRGVEPVTYVAMIYSIYENYLVLFPEKGDQVKGSI
ncbi:MAG: transporter substrate-binding domain-containing protein [Marinoscillum sp.]